MEDAFEAVDEARSCLLGRGGKRKQQAKRYGECAFHSVEVHIVALFVENRGAFAVAGEDRRVVGQAEQPFLDARAKLDIIAATEVGAPNAAAEKRVASEDPAFDLRIKADAALGVAGGADDFEGATAQMKDVAVAQRVVGEREGTILAETEP